MNFKSYPVFKEDGNYYIQYPEGNKMLYSSRGINRETAALENQIKDCPAEKTLIICAAFIPEFSALLKNKNIVWVDPCIGSHNEGVITEPSQWNVFLQSITPAESFSLYVHPRLPDREEIFQSLHDDLKQAAKRLKTIRHFKKIWEVNFKANLREWKEVADISELDKVQPPAYLVGAGPQLDASLNDPAISSKPLWSVDTALPTLLQRGIKPDLVVSIDGGLGSWEHFQTALAMGYDLKNTRIVLDPCSYPLLYRYPFLKIYSYQSSYPACQETGSHTALSNPPGNVFSAMESLFKLCFPGCSVKKLGAEQKAFKKVSHCRGSAYTSRALNLQNRTTTLENYSFFLSKPYS